MKIQCDVCEKAQATVICCADEAALCAQCDVEVHAANKLASKHQRLLLECLSTKLPPCDICQEKAAFIFCVEDRAMLCRDCDEAIHSANARAANHQRFLATGIRVALNSSCSTETVSGPVEPPPAPKQTVKQAAGKMPTMPVSNITSPPSWGVDDLLQFSDYESSDKKEQLEFNEFEWLDFGLFGDQSAAEVPQMPAPQLSNPTLNKAARLHSPYKKPRIAMPEPDEDDEEFFTVPDLG